MISIRLLKLHCDVQELDARLSRRSCIDVATYRTAETIHACPVMVQFPARIATGEHQRVELGRVRRDGIGRVEVVEHRDPIEVRVGPGTSWWA